MLTRKPDFGRECVNLTFLGTPTRWLVLAEPMRAIDIQPDEPEDFDRVLSCFP